MRLSKCKLICLAIIVIISILIGHVINLISVDNGLEDQKLAHPPLNLSAIPPIDGSFKHLMWFAQVSDLHLSIFQDAERGVELLEFCDYTMKHINPSVILATGDLTDAKTKDLIGSRQFVEEWSAYKAILDKCGTVKRTPWLDIRGNHDNFDVPSVSSKRNLFRNYSVQGQKHSRSYIHKLTVGSEKYAFIGLDACPEVGLKRPFNFIGLLPNSEVEELERLIEAASDANYTVWFGHYPTSCILGHRPGVRSIIGSDSRSLAFLCGHFHSMLGLVPNMYTIQKEGFLELELSDWKENRMYRIAAIDHGLLSFVDVKHREWPVVLVTNPKNALLQAPTREPLGAMKTSTHVRLLVFSPCELLSVRVSFDDGPWKDAVHVKGPLFVVPWKPSHFSSGLHIIHVEAADKDGRENVITHPFSLDGTRLRLKFLPRILLMLNFSAVMQVMYGLAVLFCVLPYCVLRYMNRQTLECRMCLPVLKNSLLHRWFRRIWILSNIDVLFYPIILYPLYISIGPWAVAEVLEGQYGIIFIWGIFVNNAYLPGSFTYGYAFLQLFLFHLPLVSFTSYSLNSRLLERPMTLQSSNRIVKALKISGGQAPYIVLLLSQILMAYAFYLAYGPLALFGPIRLWPIALVIWVWYHSKRISLHKIKNASRVWDVNTVSELS